MEEVAVGAEVITVGVTAEVAATVGLQDHQGSMATGQGKMIGDQGALVIAVAQEEGVRVLEWFGGVLVLVTVVIVTGGTILLQPRTRGVPVLLQEEILPREEV
eukprot:TRINITY_DN13621_c0_g1_i4.p1 TRINITY_DN13621_c0_g1~~TRINITY_DN13621_c0_g1_i4.p1  ORF type:complete len:103 (-),score=13.60 TRINITY_DN13621_c0_g1_i4:169-477(-)